jgi:hypothetical protein
LNPFEDTKEEEIEEVFSVWIFYRPCNLIFVHKFSLKTVNGKKSEDASAALLLSKPNLSATWRAATNTLFLNAVLPVFQPTG